MSDKKSKLPDFKELTSMASKLFTDVKNSVSDIIKTYQQKRENTAAPKAPEAEEHKTTATAEAPKVEEPQAEKKDVKASTPAGKE